MSAVWPPAASRDSAIGPSYYFAKKGPTDALSTPPRDRLEAAGHVVEKGLWACPKCTLENAASNRLCQVCGFQCASGPMDLAHSTPPRGKAAAGHVNREVPKELKRDLFDQFETPERNEMSICLIGGTGVGKSSLGNVLGDLKEDGFAASESIDSCTFQTTVKQARWFDDGKPFAIIDTPGLGDSEGRDTKHIAAMAAKLKEVKYVRLFLLVFNGESPRLDDHMRGLIRIFTEMFGKNFFNNVALVFTHWPQDKAAVRRRIQAKVTEESRTREFNEMFRNALYYNGPPVPCFFLDSLYDQNDKEEVQIYRDVFKQIKSLAQNLSSFECVDVQAVKALHDRTVDKFQRKLAQLEASKQDELDKVKEEAERKQQLLEQTATEQVNKEKARQRELELKNEQDRAQHQLELAKAEMEKANEKARQRELELKNEKDRAQHQLELAKAERDKNDAEKQRKIAEDDKNQAILRASMQRTVFQPVPAFQPVYQEDYSDNCSPRQTRSRSKSPAPRGGGGIANPWNRFQHEHAGQGLSQQEMLAKYRRSKK